MDDEPDYGSDPKWVTDWRGGLLAIALFTSPVWLLVLVHALIP